MNNDDAFIRIYDSNDFEGGDHGHSHSHGDAKDDGKPHGHSHGSSDEDMKHYNASMSKLKCVSFVSIFFIAA
jgi:hypothetical protein